MFKDGEIEGVIVKNLAKYKDQRGWLIEVLRDDECEKQYQPVMSYVSETLPGVARGPHEHVDQADTFAFIGPSNFKLFLWDNRKHSPTFNNRLAVVVGVDNPASVIIPPGVVHAYKNVGEVNGWVLNFPNQLYRGEGKKQPVDEIRHEEETDSPFRFF